MEVWQAILIAIVEGITEFIPVSSTGHMILVQDWFSIRTENNHTFIVFIQSGAILSVIKIYYGEFLKLSPFTSHSTIKEIIYRKSFPSIIHFGVAILPVLFLGFFFYDVIVEALFHPKIVAFSLIIGGICMIVVDLLKKNFSAQTTADITIKQAFYIGVGQCFSLIPGTSRSASTIVTGVISGVKHKAAADFSFMIALPILLIAVAYDLYRSYHNLHVTDIPFFFIGFVVSFIVGYISITLFLKILNNVKLIPFGIYRIIMGGVVLYFL